MSIVREKLVKEDIELGHGIVQITDPTDPTGAKLSGHKVGVHTIFEGVYNVRDFGALGDGVTDDTTAMQLCITTAGADAVILVPPGDYRVSNPLTITNSNVVLRGLGARWSDGNGPIIQGTDVNDDVLQITDVDNVLVDNLSLRHSVQSVGGKYVIKVIGGSQIRIENCCIVSAAGTTNCRNGITFQATATKGISNCRIKACYFSTFENLAILLIGYDATHLISELTIEDTVVLSAAAKGLTIVDYVRGVQVQGCNFESCGQSILLEPTTNDTSVDITIRNCVLNDSQTGEHICGAKVDHVVIEGNRITATPASKFGITGDLDCAHWQIVGNYLVDCTAGGVSFDGRNTFIGSNYIGWDSGYSIVLGANSQWCYIGNNTLLSNLGRITDAGAIQSFGWNLANGVSVLRHATSAPNDGDMQNQETVIWVDEAGNNLTFKVKYSGGTIKSGTVALT